MEKKYITNRIKDDGFGSQYQLIISCILYAELNGFEYVYTQPNLKTVYEDEDIKLYEIMNIEKYFKNINDIDKNIIEVVDESKTYSFVNQNIDTCLNSNTMKKIRNIFKENKNLNYFNKDFFNIAIHIRRCSLHKNIDLQSHYGDLNVDLKNIVDKSILPTLSERFTDDSYYIELMNMIRNQHPNAKFHIYSEGVESDFSNFKAKIKIKQKLKLISFILLLFYFE